MATTSARWSLVALASVFGCRSTGPTSLDEPAREPEPAGSVRTASGAGAPSAARVGNDPGGVGAGTPLAPRPGHELAAFAAGCFWGVEDAFRKVPGVVATAVGYTGGRTEAPTYEDVCTHTTGHAETVLVEFDPSRVSYDALVRVFFQIHDPTTLDRQGPDVGDQYRSAIFTLSPQQARAAGEVKRRAQSQSAEPIVTQIAPLGRFWAAEGYHQQYAERTGHHGCPVGKIDLDAI